MFLTSLLNRLKKHFFDHPVISLFVAHTLLILLFVIFIMNYSRLPGNFLLIDDGYYLIGKNFFEGNSSLSHQFRGPGIPLLLSSLNFFPAAVHPYLRLLITQLITLLNIYLGFKIFSNFFSKNAVIMGSLIALFNPLYIWWACVRSSPEIYITAFLGLVIIASLKLLGKSKSLYFSFLIVLIPTSLLFKPVLFLIPLFLLIYFFLYKRYKLLFAALFLFLVCIFSLKIVIDYTRPVNGFAYGDNVIMFDAFFTESVLKSGKLGFYQGGGEKAEENSNTQYIYSNINRWTAEYIAKYHTTDPFKMNVEFIKEKAGIVFLSKLLNPIYFISFADSTTKTIFNFVINIVILSMAFMGFKKIRKEYNQQINLLLFIFIGYYSVYFLTTSIARYFIPLLFYISIFAGEYLVTKLKLR